jgi:hypothetical protein
MPTTFTSRLGLEPDKAYLSGLFREVIHGWFAIIFERWII